MWCLHNTKDHLYTLCGVAISTVNAVEFTLILQPALSDVKNRSCQCKGVGRKISRGCNGKKTKK